MHDFPVEESTVGFRGTFEVTSHNQEPRCKALELPNDLLAKGDLRRIGKVYICQCHCPVSLSPLNEDVATLWVCQPVSKGEGGIFTN